MEWVLLFVSMTAEGGWSFHQTSFENEELCNSARNVIQEQLKEDKDKFIRMTCIQVQSGYGSLRSKRK